MIRRFIRSELGSSASEYALIISAFGLMIVAGNAAIVAAVGSDMTKQVNTLSDGSGSSPAPSPTPTDG